MKLGGGEGGGFDGALAAAATLPEGGEPPRVAGEVAVKEADGFREGMAGLGGDVFRDGPGREGIVGFLGEDLDAPEFMGTGVEDGLISSSSPSIPLELY